MGQDPEVLLGICGGVGPAAGVLLHQLILQHTASGGEDQGHLNVVHFSRSEDMTDRTEYLLARRHTHDSSNTQDASSCQLVSVENPACGMARTFAMMRAAATCGNARLVVGVPCNTFHSPPIWDEFLRLTKSSCCDVQYVHMIDETAKFITQYAPGCTTIGLLSTTGTRDSRVYQDVLEPLGFTLLEVPRSLQQELHDSIYDTEWGIKSTAPVVTSRVVANFTHYAEVLCAQGAQVIVLGCTEIPFAFPGQHTIHGVLLIDPMVALARALIREADPSRLRSLRDGYAAGDPRTAEAASLRRRTSNRT